MKVHLEHNWSADTVDITVHRRRGDASEVLRLGGPGELDRWEEVPADVKPVEPTLTLRPEVLEAIVAQAHNVLSPSAAVDRHLADATATRDRLLTLVERLIP